MLVNSGLCELILSHLFHFSVFALVLKQTLPAAIPPSVSTGRARGSPLREVSRCTTATRQPKSPAPQQLSALCPRVSETLVVEERMCDVRPGTQGDCRAVNTNLLPISTDFAPCHLVNPKLSSPASEHQSQAFCQAALTFRTQIFFSKSQVPCPSTLAPSPCLVPVHIPQLANLSSYILTACPLARISLGPRPSGAAPLLPPSHLCCTWHWVSSLAKPQPAPHSPSSPHSPTEPSHSIPSLLVPHRSNSSTPALPWLFSPSPSRLLHHNQGLS